MVDFPTHGLKPWDNALKAYIDAGDGLAAKAPSYAGARTKRYNAERNVYNWKSSNTRKLRASLGRARSGVGLAQHVVVGDSMSANCVGNTNFDHRNMWPPVMRSTLASLGVPVGGSGIVPGNSEPVSSGAASLDPRWSLAGAATNAAAMLTLYSGGSATFTSEQAGSTVNVWFHGWSAAFKVSIDGGAAVAVAPSGTPTINRYQVTGLADTVHTVVITPPASNGDSFITGIEVTRASGMVVSNLSLYGSSASAWATSTDVSGAPYAPRLAMLTGRTVDVLWLAIGANDILTGSSPTATKNSLAQIKALPAFANADVVLVGEAQPQGGNNWGAWLSALYDLADSLDCPLIDLYDRMGTFTQANANGVMGDSNHPNKLAQQDWGRSIALLAAS